MGSAKIIITLVSVGQAKIGGFFIHRGSSSKCEGCKYFNVCVKNLESTRIYKIVNIHDKILRCELYDVDMQVVEVIEADILAAIIPKQAIKCAVLTFHPQNCNKHDCENAALCFPEGLRDGDHCKVIELYESLQCLMGFHLKKALLRRVPPF